MFDDIYKNVSDGISSFGNFLGSEQENSKLAAPPDFALGNSPQQGKVDGAQWGNGGSRLGGGPKWGSNKTADFGNKFDGHGGTLGGIPAADNSANKFASKKDNGNGQPTTGDSANKMTNPDHLANKMGGTGETIDGNGAKAGPLGNKGEAGAGPKVKLANAQFNKFTSSTYKWNNFVTNNAWNVGKFDFDFNPSAKLANVTMKVKFLYPDVKGKTKKDNALRRAKSENFKNQVQNMWSRKFQFKNIREPQKVWKKLNPVSVNLKVVEDEKNPHFSINMYQNKTGRAAVNADHTVDLYKGDYAPVTAFPNTPKGETKRARAAGAKNVFFANNSSGVSGKYGTQLDNFAAYMKRIDNPKFDIHLEGHASTSGSSGHNLKLSQERMNAVKQRLRAGGLNNHNYVTNFVGETKGISGAKGRKVVVKAIADSKYVNKQDVTPHEFGHMLGLDDEYVYGTAGDKLDHHGLVDKAFGKHYAKQVAHQDDTDSASLMHGGDQLRIHHYVTIWDALVQTTLSKAKNPTPNRFGYKDWKFVE